MQRTRAIPVAWQLWSPPKPAQGLNTNDDDDDDDDDNDGDDDDDNNNNNAYSTQSVLTSMCLTSIGDTLSSSFGSRTINILTTGFVFAHKDILEEYLQI
jgi:hypothetical protein